MNDLHKIENSFKEPSSDLNKKLDGIFDRAVSVLDKIEDLEAHVTAVEVTQENSATNLFIFLPVMLRVSPQIVLSNRATK